LLEDLPAEKILRILGEFDAPLHGPGILFLLAFQIVSPQEEKEAISNGAWKKMAFQIVCR